MGLILDTSVLIAAERQKFNVADFLLSQPVMPVRLAAITYSELLHGLARATNSGIKSRRKQFIEAIVSHTGIIGFDRKEAEHHARIWADLESRGQIIGSHDLQIAATALSLDYTLATLNVKEFKRVPGLKLAEVAAFQM
ncbi:MAG: PIN domain-containing protein [Verrucomicrobiota bacterium]